ncbi:hypothetical protein ACG01O_22200, partial [Roseateles sp. BYS87W]
MPGLRPGLCSAPLTRRGLRVGTPSCPTRARQGALDLGSELARLHADAELEHGSYRNAFSAIPATLALTPRWAPRPAAQAQVARVVGLDDAVVHTDRDARVKVQFAWQRGERPNPGGLMLDEPPPASSGAPGDHRAGTWV